ncbi:oxygenase MpaB family protein [Agitococcus lubricus]|uniref:Uncharacterized protein DUF2236 n=1 Tax=Agitococcus lubricus TaxID=1077255 RepID=A0A2T5J0H1_9GAMM|nr:oxygenase MpaB family protein [Agitococcus lubricus]PTQ89848.1 uncharacterized protein DUF2236 [Agitococcus lubricus]
MTTPAFMTQTPQRAKQLWLETHSPRPSWRAKLIHRYVDWILPDARRQQLIAGLWQGDKVMDDFVSWMFAQDNIRHIKQQFERALVEGIHQIKECPAPLASLFAAIEPPKWLDEDLVRQGALAMQRMGTPANIVLRDLALMGGYKMSGFNQTLVLTGALTKGADKRTSETGQWWSDCTQENGMSRFEVGFKSTIQVRFIHAVVRRHLQTNEKWDSQTWGLPICQVDMAATYLGFCVVFLWGLRGLGVMISPQESKSIMHFWRYTCWLMGVDEQWLVNTEKEGALLLFQCLLTQAPPDWTTHELAGALAKEPLQRGIPSRFQWRQRLAYSKHLSVTRYFLGKRGMQDLGLPTTILPWYPPLVFGVNLSKSVLYHLLPMYQQRFIQQGRAEQVSNLQELGMRLG